MRKEKIRLAIIKIKELKRLLDKRKEVIKDGI